MKLFLYIMLFFGFLHQSFSSEHVVKCKESNAITEVSFGAQEDDNPIIAYVSPSCMHCSEFVRKDWKKAIERNKNRRFILRFLITSAKDIFIMKIIQNEVKDENCFFGIYENFISRCYDTINYVKPTEEQITEFKGSENDPEMINFQVIASEFGFSKQKIVRAIPEMDAKYEIALMKTYQCYADDIAELSDKKSIDLPFIKNKEKHFESLTDAIQSD